MIFNLSLRLYEFSNSRILARSIRRLCIAPQTRRRQVSAIATAQLPKISKNKANTTSIDEQTDKHSLIRIVVYTTYFCYAQYMFERCLYFNVNSLARTINRIWEEAFAEFGLAPSHAYLLRMVLEQPGQTAKQLSEGLKLEKSTITRFLHSLEEKKLVSRKSGNSGDAREVGIYPTRKALDIATRLDQTGNNLYQKMTEIIGKNKLIDLVGEIRNAETHLVGKHKR